MGLLAEKVASLLTIVVGDTDEARSVCEHLKKVGHKNIKPITDGNPGISFLNDNDTAIVYVAGELQSISWLTFIQIIRTEPPILFAL